MKTISRYIMTLALLLTAVTGAWAQEEVLLTTITPTAKEQASYSTANVATVSFSYTADGSSAYLANWGWWGYGWIATVTAAEGYTITKCIFYDDADRTATDSEAPFVVETTDEDKTPRINGIPIDGGNQWSKGINKIEVYGYVTPTAPTEPGVEVTPGSSANTWTFTMPGSDVVLTPIYAKAATFATTGTEPEVKTLLPEAAEGIIAGTNDSIVTPGIVVPGQGQVMYAVTGTNQATAPELSAFSATLPTAKDIADEGAEVLVWYYIKGADTPEGQEATAENTFNDSEICETPIKVTVLTNKFDITFNAANANTIESGKATVTVGGTAATVIEGKLEGVKMGSEVKLKANTGYKFRKVEVKKKTAAKPLANATTEDLGKVVGADGNIYATKADAEAANTTAVAMICYVNEGHGLALALSDEGDMDWNTALTTCAAHTPAVTGATWKLASKSEMNLMINAAGNYAALRNGFSAVGGTNMSDDHYWLSDESSADYAQYIEYYDGSTSQEFKSDSYKVRACLAF